MSHLLLHIILDLDSLNSCLTCLTAERGHGLPLVKNPYNMEKKNP